MSKEIKKDGNAFGTQWKNRIYNVQGAVQRPCIDMERLIMEKGDLSARYAINSLSLRLTDWKSRNDPLALNVEERCMFI
jgi:hypothetical protein